MRELFGALLAFWVFAAHVSADEPITFGHRFIIHSDVLSEDRSYRINLPASYNNGYSEHYAVLYVLDGETHFFPAAGVVNHMSSGNNANFQIPELIIVGIDNLRRTRTRDMTPTNSNILPNGSVSKSLAISGGGDRYLEFLEKELVPHIDATYRTKQHRTIFGHSFGGLIAMHSMIARPNLFQGYIAVGSNLWWDEEEIIGRAQTFVSRTPNIAARIYISNGLIGIESNQPRVSSGKRFVEQLSKSHSSALHVKYDSFSDEDRKSVSLVSLYQGLLHTFNGYWLPADNVVFDGAERLTKHYKNFSELVGVQFLPSEYFVEIMVRIQGRHMKPGVALGLLEMNAKNYPHSVRAKDSLVRYKAEMVENVGGTNPK